MLSENNPFLPCTLQTRKLWAAFHNESGHTMHRNRTVAVFCLKNHIDLQ